MAWLLWFHSWATWCLQALGFQKNTLWVQMGWVISDSFKNWSLVVTNGQYLAAAYDDKPPRMQTIVQYYGLERLTIFNAHVFQMGNIHRVLETDANHAAWDLNSLISYILTIAWCLAFYKIITCRNMICALLGYKWCRISINTTISLRLREYILVHAISIRLMLGFS